ncbi:hypothetical protein [Streptomyces sp. NPDC020607]|uniref:hypothetical protein n=1 Tax=Streptomyces sp. NPDC020607 TaxID=3365082 RepID=UPI0037B878E5
MPTCPGITTVPCPPCLQQLVQGAAEEPHECALVTHLAIDGGRLIMGGEEDCPCPHVDEESDALKAARAEARTRTEIRPPRTP